MTSPAENLRFDKGGGLVPVVVQDADTAQVLMLGYANSQAVELSLTTGKLHLWSRSRRELWLKGERSENYLLIHRLLIDCDHDTLLALVRPATGMTPVCHTGAPSCFQEELFQEG